MLLWRYNRVGELGEGFRKRAPAAWEAAVGSGRPRLVDSVGLVGARSAPHWQHVFEGDRHATRHILVSGDTVEEGALVIVGQLGIRSPCEQMPSNLQSVVLRA